METYAPIFPGFYGTLYSFADDGRAVVDSLLGECDTDIELIHKFVEENYDETVDEYYTRYTEDVAKAVCHFLTETVSEILNTDVEFEFQNIHSPKYYNFSNDSINVNLKFKDADVFMRKLLSFVKKHKKEFEQYLKDNYTSCDGFMSYYSNKVSDWMKKEYGEHEIGSMLEFVLRNSNDNIEEDMYYYVTERVCDLAYCDFKDSFKRFMESNAMKKFEKEYEALENQRANYIELMKSQNKKVDYGTLEKQKEKNMNEICEEMKEVFEEFE